jgi:hypothetical protein
MSDDFVDIPASDPPSAWVIDAVERAMREGTFRSYRDGFNVVWEFPIEVQVPRRKHFVLTLKEQP